MIAAVGTLATLVACEPDKRLGLRPPVPLQHVASAVVCTIGRGASPAVACATSATARGSTPAVAERTLRSQMATRTAGRMRNAIVIGGQDVFIRLEPGAVAYNNATQKFTVTMAVRNLLAQPLGTADLANLAPGGTGVFFDSDPVVTGGAGVVAIDNSDTSVTIGAHSNRPGFKYPEVIQAAGASAPRTWQFSMPTTVVAVEFTALVFTTLADEGAGAFAQPAGWLAMANGNGNHRCGIRAGGTLYCWQSNTWWQSGLGQLGAGRLSYALDPVTVAGGHTFLRLARSDTHTCGLDNANNIWCWGTDDFGQFGDGVVLAEGDRNVFATPRKVLRPAGVTSFIDVAVAYGATCARDQTARVWCWGMGGLLGNGSAEGSAVPVQVGGGSQFARLVGGGSTFCGLDFNGAFVACWGDGSQGQMGDGTQNAVNLSLHTAAAPATFVFSEISVGASHVCATSNDTHTYCWGYNGNGTLLGTADASGVLLSPTRVLGSEQFQQLSVGDQYTCASDASKTSYCWGSNVYGQLGDGTTIDRSVPTPTIAGPVESVIAGTGVSCATVQNTHAILCWGLNAAGAGGRMSAVNAVQLTPTSPAVGLAGVQYVVGSTTCVITEASPTACFGSGLSGMLGNGVDLTDTTGTPKGILGLNGVADVVTTQSNTCARTDAGSVYCWGAGSYGANGDGTTTDRALPIAVSILGGATSKLSASSAHVCAIGEADGLAYCWGANDLGQAGVSNGGQPVTTPTQVDPSMQVIEIGAGTTFTCAIKVNLLAVCWGGGSPAIVRVDIEDSYQFSRISGGFAHHCAIRVSNSRVMCWGKNDGNQLGDGTTIDHDLTFPTQVAYTGSSFVDVRAFGNTTCALDNHGKVFCWGDNTNGAAGQDLATPVVAIPTRILTGSTVFTALFGIGQQAACARAAVGDMVCWGLDIGIVGGRGGNTPTIVPVP